MAGAKLSDDEIEIILGLLTRWKGELTWELLLFRVEAILHRSFTRQGLGWHHVISLAFKNAKIRNRKSGVTKASSGLSPGLAFAEVTIDGLREELRVVRADRDRLIEKFVVWSYNAMSRGLSEYELERPLPPVDRGRSDKRDGVATKKVAKKKVRRIAQR